MKAAIVGIAGPVLRREEAALFAACRPAGAILFARNIEDRRQLALLHAALRRVLPPGAVLMVDQEGGRVARLRPPHWAAHPPAAALGRAFAADPRVGLRAAWLTGSLIGADCRDAGFDVAAAPVLDLSVSGAHSVIGDRALSDDPLAVARLGRAVAAGLMAAGIQPVGKHAPGHGRARVDSHLALPRVETNELEADRLEQIAGERNARRRESALQNNDLERFQADSRRESALQNNDLERFQADSRPENALEQIAGERNARRRESALQNNEPEHFLANTQPENALAADIRPFALNTSLPWMMTAHIVYPALDPISPATLSRAVIAGTIRGHMGFRGVLVTDDLAMKALSGTPADLAVQALAAGCDLALYCSGDFATTEALLSCCPDVTDTAAARLAAARAMAARRRISLNAASLQDERARLLA